MSRMFLGASLLCLLAACRLPTDGDGNVKDDDDDGDRGNTQFGEEDDTASAPGCEEVSEDTLQLTDATPWDVTVAEVMAVLTTPRTAEARRYDTGAVTTVTVSGQATGTTATLVVREGPSGGGADTGASCEDWLRFDGRMDVSDSAGWLQESISGRVQAEGADRMSLSSDIESLGGSVSLEDLIDEGAQLDGASIGNTWSGEGISGSVNVQSSGGGAVTAGRAISW